MLQPYKDWHFALMTGLMAITFQLSFTCCHHHFTWNSTGGFLWDGGRALLLCCCACGSVIADRGIIARRRGSRHSPDAQGTGGTHARYHVRD